MEVSYKPQASIAWVYDGRHPHHSPALPSWRPGRWIGDNHTRCMVDGGRGRDGEVARCKRADLGVGLWDCSSSLLCCHHTSDLEGWKRREEKRATGRSSRRKFSFSRGKTLPSLAHVLPLRYRTYGGHVRGHPPWPPPLRTHPAILWNRATRDIQNTQPPTRDPPHRSARYPIDEEILLRLSAGL